MPDKPSKPDSQPPKGAPARPASQLLGVAMELPFVLVSAILVGGFLGWLLDRWLHTRPLLMIVLGGLGFFSGLREVLRRIPGGDNDSKRN